MGALTLRYCGVPPADLAAGTWTAPLALLAEDPPWAVDGLLIFTRPTEEEWEGIRSLRRHGRPALSFAPDWPEAAQLTDLQYHPFEPGRVAGYLTALEALPRTNYRPIDCNFYDHFEAAIVTRRTVSLSYRGIDGEVNHTETRLSNTKTVRTEEYVQLGSGTWLRLDRIVSVDGVAAGVSCRF
ncbi:hypothetical protein QWY85_04055 [Neolewinella lacunae]|uniref:Uncharacterized protein n=1 Tax=Neolewinella lacunae TaxID=1517758 RepID=A0A923PMP3_9BACT|nr:hypothetical protein [Neolewinella lacunae]MBC6996840.1 hypothetical protein [Neolewinella lacunae]MDN3633818.1 hypothetical protein [Neolewinella lacunae]